MRHRAILVLTAIAGLFCACSDDSDGGRVPSGGGAGGSAGTGGAAGMGGAAGTGGAGGAVANGGAAGAAAPPTPALPPGAATVSCSMTISGSLDASDRTQTGRHSRIPPVAACGMTKAFPGNAADPSNPHLYDVYRFSNPAAAPACFNFALNYGAIALGDAGADAGSDAGGADGSELDAGLDAGADAGLVPPVVSAAGLRYLTAYSTFYPTDLTQAYLGDVGDTLGSPQTMGITVPAGGTIDVVVYAIDVAPAGAGSYTLSCSAQ